LASIEYRLRGVAHPAEYPTAIPGTRSGMIPIDVDELRAILDVDEGNPLGALCALTWNDTAALALAFVRVN
jgi:hypothetical protein